MVRNKPAQPCYLEQLQKRAVKKLIDNIFSSKTATKPVRKLHS